MEPVKLDLVPIIPEGVMGLANEQGNIEIFGHEIRRIPNSARHLDLSSQPIKRVTQLIADSVKGTTSISKKTIEIVFKSEVQEGLRDGAYTMMKTRSGEVLADAVDSTGKVVGKARVVESGKLKQLATGAFQLVSIAVAQSHLADIERSLVGIQRSIDQLQNSFDNEFIAKIKGTINYLREIGEKIKLAALPDALSEPQKNVLETISKDAYIMYSQIEEDLKTLTQNTKSVIDKQWVGTDDCHKALKDITKRFEVINIRWTLLIELACLTNIIMTYQDPCERIYTRTKLDLNTWEQLIESFSESFEKKSNELLTNSVKTNSNEMLTFRRESVQRAAREIQYASLQMSESFNKVNYNLQENSRTLLGRGKELSLSLSLDREGNVEDAAIL